MLIVVDANDLIYVLSKFNVHATVADEESIKQGVIMQLRRYSEPSDTTYSVSGTKV